jgi:LmbE family N-acetylglucosaminyl deacetylase/SAM-dependent methyltransferase
VVKFDAAEAGTAVDAWTASHRLDSLPAVDLEGIGRLVVVAAHADDETLGAGGLIAEAGARGIPVTVIVVTDGSASNPGSTVSAAGVAAIRSRELRHAIGELASSATVVELGFPDGQTDEHRDLIAAALAAAVPAAAALVAPWRGDGHRDHRIVGELSAALAAANRMPLLEYPVWMWHWARPDEQDIPWSAMQSLALSESGAAAKRAALAQYESQTVGLGTTAEDAPVLTPEFLAHFRRGAEVFILTQPVRATTKTEIYFDELYEHTQDPWRLATRWYESRKRAISVASLPQARYRSALEIGCSVGELTALLADRASAVLALDISQAAVDAAKSRTRDLPNVRIEHRDATTDFPDGPFELIVLSEVGYYWDAPTLEAMVGRITEHLADDGTILACHWRHPVADYPLRGDEVHAALNRSSKLHRLAVHVEEDFVLEIFCTDPASVAMREGFLT